VGSVVGEESEVSGIIIAWVFIFVMYYFLWAKSMPDDALHYKPVLSHIPFVIRVRMIRSKQIDIAIRIDRPPTTPSRMRFRPSSLRRARPSAEPAPFGVGGEACRRHITTEWGAAPFALTDHIRLLRHSDAIALLPSTLACAEHLTPAARHERLATPPTHPLYVHGSNYHGDTSGLA
jgi:hypothetical protein